MGGIRGGEGWSFPISVVHSGDHSVQPRVNRMVQAGARTAVILRTQGVSFITYGGGQANSSSQYDYSISTTNGCATELDAVGPIVGPRSSSEWGSKR